MTITKYMVLRSESIEELVSMVNKKIKESHSVWQPLGGITLETYPNFKPIFLQTMVETTKA